VTIKFFSQKFGLSIIESTTTYKLIKMFFNTVAISLATALSPGFLERGTIN